MAIVRRWFSKALRWGSDYGGVVGVITVGVAALALLCWAVYIFVASVSGSIRSISDPVERGMAYIAVAILAHAYFSKCEHNVRVQAGSKGDAPHVEKVRSAE